MKIILASTSKFKSEILNKVGIKHESRESIELDNNETDFQDYARNKAIGKARYIKEDGIIIGLDTITIIDNKICEKPKSKEEAKQNLRNSSDRKNRVITGYCLINTKTQEEVSGSCITEITFRKIPECDIDFYIEHEKDAMFASGFILETYMSNFIKEIKGSYYNILGVPVEKIYEILESWNIHLKDID